jgi:hypothetical protein
MKDRGLGHSSPAPQAPPLRETSIGGSGGRTTTSVHLRTHQLSKDHLAVTSESRCNGLCLVPRLLSDDLYQPWPGFLSQPQLIFTELRMPRAPVQFQDQRRYARTLANLKSRACLPMSVIQALKSVARMHSTVSDLPTRPIQTKLLFQDIPNHIEYSRHLPRSRSRRLVFTTLFFPRSALQIRPQAPSTCTLLRATSPSPLLYRRRLPLLQGTPTRIPPLL